MRALVCSERLHEALKADPVAWAGLAYVGVQPAIRAGAAPLELRACSACNSTLCKPLALDGGTP